MASAYLPADMVDGTELDQPKPLGEGTRAHLEARKRVRFDHVTERVSARMPSGEETELLGLPEDSYSLS